MREFVDIAKALSDPNRVRILIALRERELCVCQVVEWLHLAPSTVSKHMSVLRQARIVDNRKEGRWAYYRRVGSEASASVQAALTWLDGALEAEGVSPEETDRLEQILKTPVEELCRNVAQS